MAEPEHEWRRQTPDRDQPARAVILIAIAIERGPITWPRGIVDHGGSNPTVWRNEAEFARIQPDAGTG